MINLLAVVMLEIIRRQQSKYFPLVKSAQTLLLLITGLAGYLSTKCPIHEPVSLLSMTGSLLLAISGSTVLNMWFDRDIDARMERTRSRPIPAGLVNPNHALLFGLILTIFGAGWALMIDIKFGLVVLAGVLLDVGVYTIWLKRRTPWAVIWGGLSGGMPILAGRTLAVGGIDWVGILLTLGILFWIPTHIMTFAMRSHSEYLAAGIPTFPARYGFRTTRLVIALSSILAALCIGVGAYGVGLTLGYLRILILLSLGLFALAVMGIARQSDTLNLSLFKFASIYMLSAMFLMIINIL